MSPLHLTLRQLQIFLSVARAGTTMAAGEALALSQSATSSAVKELERLIGLPLFDRVGKRLVLNDNGRALLPRAMALLDGAQGIEGMGRPSSAQAHALRIGASTTIGNYVLPGLLSRFYAGQGGAHTGGWEAKVTIANTAAICERVANFELDVGLIEGPSHVPAVDVHDWVEDELVLVGSPRCEWCGAYSREGRTVPLRALREAVWLLREPGSGTREMTDQFFLPVLRMYRRSIELGSSEAIKRGVEQGLGIACLSRWAVGEALDTGQLCALRTSLPRLRRPCYWIKHSAREMTAGLQAFVDCIEPPGAMPR
jgi:DNA-binding transcriptional LysR family regulator